MPKTKKKKVPRVQVGLPLPMATEVDRLCSKFSEFSWNRQQFVESAIREKIETMRLIEAGLKNASELRQ